MSIGTTNQYILIIDENAIEAMLHKNLLVSYGFEGEIKDLPCVEYAIASIESTLKANSKLPDVILQSIDFRSSEDFETMHRYLTCRKNLGRVQHICMSCSDDHRFFEEILDLNDQIRILVKPLTRNHCKELLINV